MSTPDSQPTPGAAGNLQGDGTGANNGAALSSTLRFLNYTSNAHESPTAVISGAMGPVNTGGLVKYWREGLGAGLKKTFCHGSGTNEPLLTKLANDQWRSEFGQDSDSVVPQTSQTANGNEIAYPNVIHSSGMVLLGFGGSSHNLLGIGGSTELDKDTGVPLRAIQLLNTPVSNTDTFRHLTPQ